MIFNSPEPARLKSPAEVEVQPKSIEPAAAATDVVCAVSVVTSSGSSPSLAKKPLSSATKTAPTLVDFSAPILMCSAACALSETARTAAPHSAANCRTNTVVTPRKNGHVIIPGPDRRCKQVADNNR